MGDGRRAREIRCFPSWASSHTKTSRTEVGPPITEGRFSSMHRTFLLAADDECDRIEQPCFVQAQLASASENQACQCQRQNGLNFQVSLPAPPFDPNTGNKAKSEARMPCWTSSQSQNSHRAT